MNYRNLTLKKLMKKPEKVIKFLEKQGYRETNIVDTPEGIDGTIERDIYTALDENEIMIVIDIDNDITFLKRPYGSDDCLTLANTEMIIEDLIDFDIERIKIDLENNDTEFLRTILSGYGSVPYNKLTPEELHGELTEMRATKRLMS